MTKKPNPDQLLNAVFWLIEADIIENADGDVKVVAQWLLDNVRQAQAAEAVKAYDKQLRAEGKRIANVAAVTKAVAADVVLTFGNDLSDDLARNAGLTL